MTQLFVPREYQQRAIDFGLKLKKTCLFLWPGLGKTAVTLSIIKELLDSGEAKKVLIIAPLRVCYQVWPKEIKKWTQFKNLDFTVLHGPDKLQKLKEQHQVYIINPDGLSWFAQNLSAKTFNFDLLVLDESTMFKNTDTKRFALLKVMLKFFKYRFCLSGSPTAKGLMDLFGQMYIADMGVTFGNYKTTFMYKYFFKIPDTYEWILRPGAQRDIYNKLEGKVLVMKDEDYIDMPDLIVNDVEIDLNPAAKTAYMRFEDLFYLAVKEGSITAVNAAVKSMKCRQLANGCAYLDDSEGKYQVLHDDKLEALMDIIRELRGQPVLVGYAFEHDYERIIKFLFRKDLTVRAIKSGMSPRELDEVCTEWNKGQIDVLLAHPQSAGHGLNLQEISAAIVWFSLPWSFELYDQFIRRVWRSGQKSKVVVHRLLCKNTVDQDMAKALSSKDRTQNSFVKAFKERREQSSVELSDMEYLQQCAMHDALQILGVQ